MILQIEYKGITLGTSERMIVKLDGVGVPPIRTSKSDLIGAHGGNIWYQKYGMRVIGMEISIVEGSSSDYFNAVRNILSATGSIDEEPSEFKITRWDGVVRIINVRPYRAPISAELPGESTMMSALRIELAAENPFFGSNTTTSENITLSDPGGFPLAAPLPMPLGSMVVNTATITNNGEIEDYPVIRINGEVSNPTITNKTTGKYFKIKKNISYGNYVEIDYDIKEGTRVLYNGTDNYIKYLEGDLFTLDSGDNIIAFTASEYSSTASASVTWRDKFLSLY